MRAITLDRVLKRRLNLLQRFSLLSFVSLLAFCVGLGLITSRALTRNMMDSEWQDTAERVRYHIRANRLEGLFVDKALRAQPERYRRSLSSLLELPEVVKVKVWDPKGAVIWATDPRLIGQTFPGNAELQRSLAGHVSVELKALEKAEHVYERQEFSTLAEVYVPIFAEGRPSEVIGVLEVYKMPARLFATARRVTLAVWSSVAVGGVLLYLSLFWIVRVSYRRELALQRSLDERDAKNAALDGFVHTVAHDLKAPLMTIQGMVGAVLEDHAAALDAEGRHYLERVQVTSEKMERLLLDLLALARIGNEARPAEQVHLDDVVDDVLMGLSQTLRERGIKVSIGDLAAVWAIPVQMEQIVRNLVTNAIKYMGDTPEPMIEIGTIDRGTEVEFWIRDSGIGIDPAYHEKVFQIFQRLKEVDAEGTGVGLPIVKKIVESDGGRIWVESAVGEGSTFRFTWPRPR
jgi:signal transduction histidine kinase